MTAAPSKLMRGRPAALYIHVPFCARACPYCDFDFEVGRSPAIDPFMDGLERDLATHPFAGPDAALAQRAMATVYIGGGTPSLLGATGLDRLARWIRARFDLSALREWTVELNPEHVDDALVAALVSAGIDRVSVGVQSFDEKALRQLGRVHTGEQAVAALQRLRTAGLRVSADLIVGWPGQSKDELARDLQILLATNLDHVSVYALTIEAQSAWPRLVRRGLRVVPDEDVQAERLLEVEATLAVAGFDHYEISSYGRGGDRGHHNLGYWSWGDYLGLGPSAASALYRDDGSVVRVTNERGLASWCDASRAADARERLDPVDAAKEGLWLGLRRLEGLDIAAFLQRFPAVDEGWLEARIQAQEARGNLVDAQGRLRVASERWLQHDAIAADLLR